MITEHTTPGGTIVVVPIPFNGFAPGHYINKCNVCKDSHFNVDKLSFVCEACAIAMVGFNLEKVGYITNNNPPVFDFDPEPYVEKVAEAGEKGTNSYACLYMNHKYEKPIPTAFTCGSAEESFLSWLTSIGYLWENIEGKGLELPALGGTWLSYKKSFWPFRGSGSTHT